MVGDRPVLRSPRGLFVAQSSDGAIVLASDRATLERGLPAEENPPVIAAANEKLTQALDK